MKGKYYCDSEDGKGICAITHNRCRILDIQDCKDCMVARKYEGERDAD